MKIPLYIPAFMITMFIISACTNTPTETDSWQTLPGKATVVSLYIDAAEAAMRANQIVHGNVENVERVETHSQKSAWDVTIRFSKEWVMTAQLDAVTGGLLSVRGEFAPDHCNFAPGAYFVPLSTVAMIVQKNMDAQITAWQFERSTDYNEWIYQLTLLGRDGTTQTIVMSAVSRELLTPLVG